MAIAIAASLGGIAIAWLLFGRSDARSAGATAPRACRWCPPRLAGFWLRGWDFDRLYDALLVRPFVAIARLNRDDVVDLLPRAIAAVVRAGNARRAPHARPGACAGTPPRSPPAPIVVLALVFYA